MDSLRDLPTNDLVTRAQRGCRESFGWLVERHVKSVYNVLLRRTGSHEDAEELSQECFLRAWRKLATYRSEWSFSTWVHSIARSVATDRARVLGGTRGPEEVAEEPAAKMSPSEFEERDESAQLWRAARAALDDDQHAALWHFYAEDKSASEIGAILGRSALAVRLLLFRARSALREHLRESRAATHVRGTLVLRSPAETIQ